MITGFIKKKKKSLNADNVVCIKCSSNRLVTAVRVSTYLIIHFVLLVSISLCLSDNV